MIKSVQFCINHATKIRGYGVSRARLYFKPGYNVLIGPNGSGKSTVLRALASCPLCKVDKEPGDIIKYITTETLTPLAGGHFSTREEMIQGIRALFRSHGQGVLDTLQSLSHGKETVILIDSPETGQDDENSALIHQGLLKMARNYQVIVATNALCFMRGGHRILLDKTYLSRLVRATRELLDSPDFRELDR